MAKDPETKQAAVKDLSFEQAMQELEKIVSRLEQGNVALEESISIYERGELLRTHCDKLLSQAEAKVEKIAGKPDKGDLTAEPITIE